MKSLLRLFAIAILAVGLSYAVTKSRHLERKTPFPQDEAAARAMRDQQTAALPKVDNSEKFLPRREGVITAVMTIRNRGDLVIELYPAEAPATVKHIVELINSGYYNGLQVANYVAGELFVTGGSVNRLKNVPPPPNEKVLRAVRVPVEKNTLKNVTGALALAVDKDPKSKSTAKFGGTRFFVNLRPNHPLDALYPVFGKVISGIEVAKKMAVGDVVDRFVVR